MDSNLCGLLRSRAWVIVPRNVPGGVEAGELRLTSEVPGAIRTPPCDWVLWKLSSFVTASSCVVRKIPLVLELLLQLLSCRRTGPLKEPCWHAGPPRRLALLHCTWAKMLCVCVYVCPRSDVAAGEAGTPGPPLERGRRPALPCSDPAEV